MPRRNRRVAVNDRPPRVMTLAQRRDLEHFAREHLAAHADAVASARPDELPMTGSEHPRTGIRFLSAGNCPDRHAMRLAGAAGPSEPSGNLA